MTERRSFPIKATAVTNLSTRGRTQLGQASNEFMLELPVDKCVPVEVSKDLTPDIDARVQVSGAN